jgi:O-antigen/teichoic acid export membrane protein
MFNTALIIFNVIMGPMWPAYGEAIARGDILWVKKTYSRSLKIILLTTALLSVFFIIFGNKILYFWVGPQISPPLLLNIGLGLWIVVCAFGGTMSILLNASGIYRFQIICIFITIISSIIFKCLFIYFFKLSGIIWGTLTAYILFFIIPYSYFIKNLLYNASDFPKPAPAPLHLTED